MTEDEKTLEEPKEQAGEQDEAQYKKTLYLPDGTPANGSSLPDEEISTLIEYVDYLVRQVGRLQIIIQVLSSSQILMESFLMNVFPEIKTEFTLRLKEMSNLAVAGITNPELAESVEEALKRVADKDYESLVLPWEKLDAPGSEDGKDKEKEDAEEKPKGLDDD